MGWGRAGGDGALVVGEGVNGEGSECGGMDKRRCVGGIGNNSVKCACIKTSEPGTYPVIFFQHFCNSNCLTLRVHSDIIISGKIYKSKISSLPII